ncbi:hypothetical protein DFO62_101237 [Serratia fonticola]|nr:hypothetical protein DFO62_101237 [Serratia fonticola]
MLRCQRPTEVKNCAGRCHPACLGYRPQWRKLEENSSDSPWLNRHSSLLRLSIYFQKHWGYQLPLPVGKEAFEFVEITDLLPKALGLSTPSPCGRGLG